ncbi:MAG: NADH-quinone oxidoreductase subunit C [Nitratireductor sp.]|nr:NADH-quinone oxidoreductase subunit C [Nitratireductor sp.]
MAIRPAIRPAIRDEALNELAEVIEAGVGDKILSMDYAYGELTVHAKRETIVELMRFLKNDSQTLFWNIIDLCGVDYPERAERFDVVYHLLSPRLNARLRVKVTTDEETPVASITEIFPGANWFEREAWDMYGILFTGHPDLRRLLTDYGFEGHPLRKDFPLTGYVEVRYDDALKRVVYEPVRLRQEFRDFDFESPWEGTDYVLPGDEKAAG